MHPIEHLYDLDHVMLLNGNIYRVLGNFRNTDAFLGYNVYSPDDYGDRLYLGKSYSKNYTEDERLRHDVLEMYELVSKSDIHVHFDPVDSAKENAKSFHNTIWFALYEKLKALFGEKTVGIFGSSMFSFHLTPEGHIRKDIDFVIEGLEYVDTLRHALPEIRQQLGFHEISVARQLQQYQRYQKVFRNNNNSIHEIIKRRWTGLQLSEKIVSTLRFRDKSIVLPFELVQNTSILQRNVVVSGKVSDAVKSNLFPQMFTLETHHQMYPVYIFWWKFSTPVCDNDNITLCGDVLLLEGREVLRVTHFSHHWVTIEHNTMKYL